ncbi:MULTISPECIES: HlyD family efflux transporter periplasmic adaptor subunit [unclassified Fusibacter]|uniref:HlyD family efflux transporter periplasmic adaptor subunit n=1 Tax=unclassified Fusibacter TaxID=2624464 RepID=UPI0010123D3E|nr:MULTISPECIES: HlyD family efflux transporter periplasmic adaptor subunit [unclassified Fusibacter]MCK8058137.1 HlyD family efflux transporter periplasmic adaptor subunit [Fusibacter sp. A2]NPE20719.1 HlyD family efflux transporter periplasmic adaptor subunit [Fusibacter sp. A1]RXV62923.1 HlyD family efflux transporter periplasmic adaptor subunit [Fusibacter sp. A1]
MSEIDVVVKSSGVVRPYKNVNTISNMVTSRVEEVYFQNGDFVQAGETILKLDIEGFEIEENSLLVQLAELEEELELLELYKEAVQTNTNLFALDGTRLEENYHYVYLKYEMERNSLLEKSKMFDAKLYDSQAELDGTNAFLKSIESGNNSFSQELMATESYQEYTSYLLQLNEINISITNYSNDYEIKQSLLASGGIAEAELTTAKLNLDTARNQYSKFVSDTKLSLKTKLERYAENLHNFEGELSNQSNFSTQTLININSQVQNKNKELNALKTRMKSLNLNMIDTELKAPISGYVNFNGLYSVGDYMSPGKEVATIIPENGESFKIQMYVPNKDISNIDVGDQVKYRFDALPYKEYGVLEGKIKNISVDASYNETQGTSYYLVESTVVNKPMVSYKGTQATIKVGMSLEAQVITESKSVLHYLLEKIDLWD